MELDITQYLDWLKSKLLTQTTWQPVRLEYDWIDEVPTEAGVYVFREEKEYIYVGESGSLRGRMNDMLNSQQHTLRRSLGKRLFSHRDDFEMATSKKKFPPTIEALLTAYINAHLEVVYLPVALGRKELEEWVDADIKLEYRLNKRAKRAIRVPVRRRKRQ
jgi:hypothetical protein